MPVRVTGRGLILQFTAGEHFWVQYLAQGFLDSALKGFWHLPRLILSVLGLELRTLHYSAQFPTG